MAKTVDSMDEITIEDLISDNGIIFNMNDNLTDESYEPHPYRPNADLTNDEMIRLLNMEEYREDDDDDGNDVGKDDTAEGMAPWSISFDKIKGKSVDLTKDGKVMKLTKQNGVGELVPQDGLVVIHYGGYIEHQDEPFDSTFFRGSPDRFRLNAGQLISGLEIGICTMKKHEIACFVLHPDYAYGALGCVPLIPPNSEILFIVRLVDFIDGGSAETLENLSIEERKQFSNVKTRIIALIKTAADSFKRNKTKQAIREYNRAVTLLEASKLENDEEENEMKRLLTRAYSNLAVCFNKIDKPRHVCKACVSVPYPTAKTHFHHGRALIRMGEYKRALEELQIALRDDPKNIIIIREIELANLELRKHAESEKKLWANCLKIRNGEQTVNEYAEFAKNFCVDFAKNDLILRQPLPGGLTPAEDKCIRHEAAILGLNVVQQERYGTTITYLAKSAY